MLTSMMLSRTVAAGLGEVPSAVACVPALPRSSLSFWCSLASTFGWQVNLPNASSERRQCSWLTSPLERPEMPFAACTPDALLLTPPPLGGAASSALGEAKCDGATQTDLAEAEAYRASIAWASNPLTASGLCELERRCSKLEADNLALRSALQKAGGQLEHVRGLNRRLIGEVQEAKAERAHATEAVESLERRLQQASGQPVATRCASREVATSTAELQGPAAEDRGCQQQPLQQQDEEAVDSLGAAETAQPASLDLGSCTCGNPSSWGCGEHRSYSAGLLLAHRPLRAEMCSPAPGLEASELKGVGPPPGLEFVRCEAPPGLASLAEDGPPPGLEGLSASHGHKSNPLGFRWQPRPAQPSTRLRWTTSRSRRPATAKS